MSQNNALSRVLQGITEALAVTPTNGGWMRIGPPMVFAPHRARRTLRYNDRKFSCDLVTPSPPPTDVTIETSAEVAAGPAGIQTNLAKEAAKPKEPKRRRITRAEAEILVRDWLAVNAKGAPHAVTRDAVAAGTGVSAGLVSQTAAWRAFAG